MSAIERGGTTHALSIIDSSPDRRTEQEMLRKRVFDNSVAYQEWLLRNQLSLYDKEQPASQYVTSLLGRLHRPKDRYNYRVTVYKGEPNAFCLPNGSIYISDKLLRLVDAEEELLFALQHEKNHVEREHAAKAAEKARARSTGKVISQALNHFGQARFHEWEADIRTFKDLEELKINPMGGISLFEKFKRYEQGYRRDVVHGANTDRVLNLRMMTRIQDVTTVQDPFTPISQEIQDNLISRTGPDSVYKLFVTSLEQRDTAKLDRILKQAQFGTSLLLMPEVIRAYSIQRNVESRGGKAWAEYQRAIGTILGQTVWKHIDEVFASSSQTPLSDKQKTFAFHSLLELVGGAKMTDPENQEVILHKAFPKVTQASGQDHVWNKRTIGFYENIYTGEDVDALIAILKPEIFERLEVKLNFKPDSLVETITKRVLAREIYLNEDYEINTASYIDFADRFTTALTALYQTHGAIEIDPETIFTSFITRTQSYLSDTEYAALRQAAVEKRPELSKLFSVEDKEATPAEKLVHVVRRYLTRDAVISGKNVASVLSMKEVMEDTSHSVLAAKLQKEITNFLRQLPFENQEQTLEFLVSFRHHLMEDGALWGNYEQNYFAQTVWANSIVNNLAIRFFPKDQDSVEKALFMLKASLLVQSDGSIETSSPLHRLEATFSKLVAQSTFTVADYERFYALAKEGGLDRELGQETHVANLLSDERFGSYGWAVTLRRGIYQMLDNALTTSESKAEFEATFLQLTTKFPYHHYGVDIDYKMVDAGSRNNDDGLLKNRLLSRIFDIYQFDLQNPQDIKTLYFLTTYFDNTSYAVRLQETLWEKVVTTLSFADGLDFLRQEIQARRLLSLESVQRYIDKHAKTHHEIEQAKSLMIELLTASGNASEFGSLVVAEQFVDMFFNKDKPEFLFACLGNRNDDGMLKRYIYQRWRRVYDNFPVIAETMNVDAILNHLYSLDAQTKYVLIRNLLTGDGGLLTHKDPKYRVQLVDMFVDNYIEATSETEVEMKVVIRDVMKEMVQTADYDLIYFALAPLLQNRILIPPATQVEWRSIVEAERPPRRYHFSDQYMDKKRRVPKPSATNEILKILGGNKRADVFKANEGNRQSYETVVNSLLDSLEEREVSSKMSTTEFISEMGQILGAPGVRFLQFMIQTIDLSGDLEQAFSGVYDKVKGQSKITADATVLREWPQSENDIRELLERVGGGSLMSVFKTFHTSGEYRALKVLNPNAAFHTETTYQVLSKVFTNLAAREARFAPALAILDDISEWIQGDIDFTNFLEEDAQFRQQHHGFTVDGTYAIKIPVTYDPENKYFIQEEFIEGTNLTDTVVLEAEGHDLKKIMSLVTKNFFTQLASGKMHANIHPGNIRVTADNKVALLDRNFYQSISSKDSEFLVNIASGYGDIAAVVDHCVGYLASEGQVIDEAMHQRLYEQGLVLNDISDPTEKLLGLSVMLRKEGLRFPLRMSLLVQNFFYLDRMNKKAGFTGIMESLSA